MVFSMRSVIRNLLVAHINSLRRRNEQPFCCASIGWIERWFHRPSALEAAGKGLTRSVISLEIPVPFLYVACGEGGVLHAEAVGCAACRLVGTGAWRMQQMRHTGHAAEI